MAGRGGRNAMIARAAASVSQHKNGTPKNQTQESRSSYHPAPYRLRMAVPSRARACAREKSLKNFGLVPLRFASVQRCRALAVIMSLMPTSELVCDWSSVMALSISGSG